ncbi:serine/threonine-protein phosphatase 4 regulatory subunit 3A isoform X2 [Daktulosphaira vitifoliae]|uniref:serine/threonine-protein phosphatase 4 regulatory subunit 3A isoform X2 n=1 Tax=Daktulosphaira vitifoliae TaxID=58002 RepID=UPI0021AA5617|nr:serine/threonine-protein phosphatase 4 regulatory subunit 3A isoform X2 [Daktulosphaira vitifoliae]
MFGAMTDTKRRVKLYALNVDRQWDDRGTGHVSCTYVERLKGVSLLVRAEADGALLLESKIQHDTVYQKQQDTLIVWSEADNFDLALSFQEKAGCEEIWEKICSVQGKDPTIETTQDIVEESEDERFDDLSDSAPPVELPPCEIGRLKEIKDLFMTCMATPLNKDRLAEAIENDGYIRKLVKLFNLCEDLNNLEGLHCLYDIIKNIFLINKNGLFEMLFADDIIFDVIGCLEYDPTQPIRKYHRHHLKNVSRFKEVIMITNMELLNKIHQTHRVQYIQDVVLPTPSVFEDNMLSALNSFIFFNKVEIVTLIQEDEKFLPDLLGQLQDENTPDPRKLELVQFLKEFCNFSQNLQPPQKENFFKTLTSLGILPMLEMTLMSEDVNIKQAAIDILTILVEFSPSVIREYILQQSTDNVSQANGNEVVELMLMNVIIEQMICDTDPDLGRAVQLMGVIRVLIDPENMLPSLSKVEKTDFLNYFYKNSVHVLIAPLLANTVDGEPARDDYQNAQLLAHILELLTFCVEHHSYHIKTCILNKDLLKRVLVLMKSAHKFLVLGALRFMRKIVALKDEFYNRYIVKGCLFGPVIDCLLENNGRYNLLDSAIIELFEFIKLEDIKILIAHIVENYGKKFEHIDYVQTFKALRIRHSQHTEKLKEKPITNMTVSTGRFRRDPRQLEDEEEIWFNNEDDEFDDSEAVVPHTGMTSTTPMTASEQLDSIGKSIDKKCEGSSTKIFGTTVNKTNPVINNNLAVTPTLGSSTEDPKNNSLLKKALVDYEGDSDEEEDENGDLKSPTKRPRYT